MFKLCQEGNLFITLLCLLCLRTDQGTLLVEFFTAGTYDALMTGGNAVAGGAPLVWVLYMFGTIAFNKLSCAKKRQTEGEDGVYHHEIHQERKRYCWCIRIKNARQEREEEHSADIYNQQMDLIKQGKRGEGVVSGETIRHAVAKHAHDASVADAETEALARRARERLEISANAEEHVFITQIRNLHLKVGVAPRRQPVTFETFKNLPMIASKDYSDECLHKCFGIYDHHGTGVVDETEIHHIMRHVQAAEPEHTTKEPAPRATKTYQVSRSRGGSKGVSSRGRGRGSGRGLGGRTSSAGGYGGRGSRMNRERALMHAMADKTTLRGMDF